METIYSIFKRIKNENGLKVTNQELRVLHKQFKNELLYRLSKEQEIDLYGIGKFYIKEGMIKKNHYNPRTQEYETLFTNPKIRFVPKKSFSRNVFNYKKDNK